MRYLIRIPEYYLIVLLFSAAYTPPFSINPFAIPLLAVLFFQLIYRNKIAGQILAGLLSVCSVYFLLALISEFSEFAVFNITAQKFLFFGLAIFLVNLMMAVAMFFRYSRTFPKLNIKAERLI